MPVSFVLEPVPSIIREGERYQIGQQTFIASRNITTGDGEDVEIPVTIVAYDQEFTIIVQFNADDDWRDVIKGEIHPVATILLTRG